MTPVRYRPQKDETFVEFNIQGRAGGGVMLFRGTKHSA